MKIITSDIQATRFIFQSISRAINYYQIRRGTHDNIIETALCARAYGANCRVHFGKFTDNYYCTVNRAIETSRAL